jgi:CBS domain-containing protein
MEVRAILAQKGQKVVTLRPTETIQNAARRMRMEGIGSAVVSSDGQEIMGLFSERDILLGIAEHGAAIAQMPISDFMSVSVTTCAPNTTIATVMKLMTNRRIRHLPVVENGRLCGIVSIGDVVKHRMDEVQLEANVLRDYAIASHS